MRNTLLMALLLFVLVACGKEETAQPAVEEAPADEAITVDDATDSEVLVDEEIADDTLEVVEESAAEPEEGEQEILLAQADIPEAPQEWQFSEGRHFTRLVPTQPTVGGADKIEVAEFFWYGCPHCYTFEPTINEWADNAPANVRFVRIPATWNGILMLHARLFYTEEILVRNGVIQDPAGFREAVFQEYHRRGNRMTSEGAIQKVFERFGVSAEEFTRTWNSFEVDQKLRVANDLMRRYSVASVPAVVVNGKFRTGAAEAGGNDKWIELIDELVVRESIR